MANSSGYLVEQLFYEHHSLIPESVWRWAPCFLPHELACKGGGSILINPGAFDTLLRGRLRLGRPVRINSAYRSIAHNIAEGGSPSSRHLVADAFDLSTVHHDVPRMMEAMLHAGFRSFGLYPNFIHFDTRIGRWWTGRWTY